VPTLLKVLLQVSPRAIKLHFLSSTFNLFMTRRAEGDFKVKCMLCHENKNKYDKFGKPEFLSITNNSVYNARRHITV
jgi:hypothetical protein